HTPATHVLHTLSLHDALPISKSTSGSCRIKALSVVDIAIPYFLANTVPVRPPELEINFKCAFVFFKHGRIMAEVKFPAPIIPTRSEEHTSELQSRENLVCRLL